MPDLQRDLLNSDTIWKYKRDMHAELKNVSPTDKKRYNEIISKYQRLFVMEALPEYIDEAERAFDAREATIMKNCQQQCYDLDARIDQLDRERAAFRAEMDTLPMTQIAMEFTTKLIDGNGPQDSEMQRQIELQGIKCGPDEKYVSHPYTQELACIPIDPNPLSRAWTWFGRLFVDGSDWMEDRINDTHDVNKNGADTGANWLTGITSAVISPFAWLGKTIGNAVLGGSVVTQNTQRFKLDGSQTFSKCGPGTHAQIAQTGTQGGIVCIDSKTGKIAAMDASGQGVSSESLAKLSSETKKEEKKEDKGFWGWASDGLSGIAKGIGGIFGMADAKEEVKPSCGSTMQLTKISDAWHCMPKSMFQETVAVQPALTSSASSSAIEFETKHPNYNYANKPNCSSGYFAKKSGKGWNCVKIKRDQPTGQTIRIGEGDTTFNVNKCPDGTRLVVTNIPRKGDATCMIVKSKGPGIFMKTPNPHKPWIELKKCPGNMETVISHEPAPNDMTCRTPVGPRAGDQIRFQKTLEGYNK
jgi:hypothetical protein